LRIGGLGPARLKAIRAACESAADPRAAWVERPQG
jgi:hypothetical protein